ncbi:MAG: sensor domain-containing diguanylate cyclase [Desulfobacterales bacterium]|jgi:diguanylate cyclase (GGDEF)-like protein
MNDFKTINELLRHNEEIARKFFEIEKSILAILNYTDLFEVLLTEIRKKFRVPYVWISVIAKSEVSRFIESLESSELLRRRVNVIDKKPFVELVGHNTTPILVNEDLTRYGALLPGNRKYFFKSLAIAPITLDGEIIGSLNQADISRKRFQPGIDTSLLERLAVKVSLCLSNVTAHERLKYLAYHDPLTGLLNRRVMETVLKREFSRTQRYGGNLSVVFVDLDDFKQVNDIYGHDNGDKLLKYVGNRLLELSRDTDVVARFAGDEFVIILPETTQKSAESLMRRIQTYFTAHPFSEREISIPVAVSFGVASAAETAAEDPGRLLKIADERLYSAKKSRCDFLGK